MRVQPGDIWTVSRDPTVANEQRGVRPCPIVSSERFNRLPIHQAIVVPFTSRERGLAHHVLVIDDGALTRPSWAMCEAVRAVSTTRFGSRIGVASSETRERVGDQIALWFLEET